MIALPQVELTDSEYCGDCGGKCCSSIGLPPFEANNPEFGSLPKSRRMGYDDLYVEAVLYDMQVFADMPRQLRLEHADAALRGWSREDKPCIWLQDGKCMHYEHRPYNCVRWQVNGSECVNTRHKGAKVVANIHTKYNEGYWYNPQGCRKTIPSLFTKIKIWLKKRFL